MELFFTVTIFLVLISFLVFVHELGHFGAAKLSGIPVETFSIGFGPALYGRKWKGTTYKICLVPLGGYVQISGEQDSEIMHGFRNKSFKIKAFVLSAGVFMNLITAMFLFQGNLLINNYKVTLPMLLEYNFTNVESAQALYPIQIVEVIAGGNSDGYLKEGQLIVGIEGVRFKSHSEFLKLIENNTNKNVEFEFFDLETFTTSREYIPVKEKNEEGKGILQVLTADINASLGVSTYFVKYKATPLSAFSMTFDMALFQIKGIHSLVAEALKTGDYSNVGNAVGGPLQIGGAVGEVVRLQVYDTLISLTGIISLSLGIFNILPLPALDGGQIVIAAYESLTKRRLKDESISFINLIGFGLLIILSIAIGIKDIIQLNILGAISSFFGSVLGR